VPFDAILGQVAAVGTLTRALRAARVHHAMRFEGIDGVGKEMAAMALAQALVCTSGEPLGCGACSACTRAVTFADTTPSLPLHPDVILVERGLYPPETIGRRTPELQDISVDQIRTVVLGRAPFPPHEGRARLFLVRRADELNLSAANALLKTLEEPGNGTYFVLLTSRPARLPDTVRSRTFRIRFGALPDAAVVEILERRGLEARAASEVAALAGGSASAALALADEAAFKDRTAFVEAAVQAITATDLGPALALAQAHSRDKRALREALEALSGRIARSARADALKHGPRASSLALRYQIVQQALRDMERNAAPALTIESMLLRLRAVVG
jgi:DNA polymerase-3 subunit delta'